MHCASSKACTAWHGCKTEGQQRLSWKKDGSLLTFFAPKTTHVQLTWLWGNLSTQGLQIGHEVSRTGCIQKIWAVNLNSCICSIVVLRLDIKAGDMVMKCRVPGCKTVWVSKSSHYWNFTTHIYQFHHDCMNSKSSSKTWSCPVCISAKQGQQAWSYV